MSPTDPSPGDESFDTEQPTAEETALVRASGLRRSHLVPTMDETIYEKIVDESLSFIERRFSTMQGLTDVSKGNNLNPFLMLLMATAYNVFSPFEVAEYLQNAKMPHGDATAFGKFIEDRIFPLFGVARPLEKSQDKTRFSCIDAELTVEGARYLTTWKAGPWTMNQSHANEMVTHLPEIHASTGADVIIGIFYGSEAQLNNKPAVVRRGTGDYVHVLVGAALWEFVTGVEDAHLVVLSAIREAQGRFAVNHGGKTFYEHMIESRLALAESFRTEFNLTGDNTDMWSEVFKRAF